MNLTIKTEVLQEMVSKVSKCASNNKLIPITSLMNIRVANNYLRLATTDATNYFYVTANDKVDCEDFEISVVSDMFTKLVQKTTSETVTLSLDNNILEVKGNGNYKLELPLDDGKAIKFPTKLPEDAVGYDVNDIIKKSYIEKILNYNKPALAVDLSLPACCSYYVGDSVMSTDRFKVCRTGIKLLSKELLVTPQVMELLGIMEKEDIDVTYYDGYTIFRSGNDELYAPNVSGVETFPKDSLNGLIDSEFKSYCKVDKSAVLEMLDRLSLFVSSYDKKAITLTFTENGIMFSSKKSNGTELVPYIDSKDFVPYTCDIDIEFLRSQIVVQEGETVNISYGSDIAIKMDTNNVTQIVALIDNEGE